MSNKEALQFSALEVDADLVGCAFNNAVLVSVLFNICLNQPETVEDITGVCLAWQYLAKVVSLHFL